MTMVIEVEGNPYDNFISGEVQIRLDVLCNTFSLVMARSNSQPLPFKVGSECKILINNVLVLTGVIELMTVEYEDVSHTIELAGRDNTSDLLDSSIDELSDIAEGPTLKSIIEQVITNIGSSILVVEGTDTIKFNSVNDIASPESGDNAFTFVEGLARQRQVLLTSNGEGNVVITQGVADRLAGARIQNIIGALDNNVKSSTVSYDNTGRYNLYKLTGQGNPSALVNAGDTDLDTIVNRGGGTSDTEIRKGRQLVLSAESSFSDDDSFNRAKWEANIRRARGRLYTVRLFSYSVSGSLMGTDIWEVNKLVSISDDFAGISGDMLVNSVVFSLDDSGGSISEITFVEPDAYTLALEEPVSGEGFL